MKRKIILSALGLLMSYSSFCVAQILDNDAEKAAIREERVENFKRNVQEALSQIKSPDIKSKMESAIKKTIAASQGGLHKMSNTNSKEKVYLTCVTGKGGVTFFAGRLGECYVHSTGEFYTLGALTAGLQMGDVEGGAGAMVSVMVGYVKLENQDDIKGSYYALETGAADGIGLDMLVGSSKKSSIFLIGPAIGSMISAGFTGLVIK